MIGKVHRLCGQSSRWAFSRAGPPRAGPLRKRIRRVMGPAHPMEHDIKMLLWKAMNEQLDWRLDDLGLPEPILEVLARQGLC